MYCSDLSGIVKNVIYAVETDSTNNMAKNAAAQNAESGTLFVADRQTLGRGRRGRVWQSEDSEGLWMSLLIRPNIVPEYASMLTLVAAMAVADTIDEVCNVKQHNDEQYNAKHQFVSSYIKWPNDIVINGKKVCGILTEMSAKPGKVEYVVIGIGINVNTKVFEDSIKETATSLYMEYNTVFDKACIVSEFSKHFKHYYEEFLKTCDMSMLMKGYNERLVNVNKLVNVEQEGQKKTGKALGIDKNGALMVEFNGQNVEYITAGEVSVRGIYGYV